MDEPHLLQCQEFTTYTRAPQFTFKHYQDFSSQVHKFTCFQSAFQQVHKRSCLMADNKNNIQHRPHTRVLNLPQLSQSFVPATRHSSSSGGGSFSETMANSDGVSDRSNGGSTRANHSEYAVSNTARDSESQVREDISKLAQSVADISNRVTTQELLLKNQHVDDTSLLQNASSAVKQRISEAFLEAADEQYRMGDILQQKAAAIFSSSPNVTPKRCSARATTPDNRSASVLDKLPELPAVRGPVAATAGSIVGVATTASGPPTPASAALSTPSPVKHKFMKKTHDTAWVPRAVRKLQDPELGIECDDLETFPWEDLTMHLRGEQWSPGLYYAESPSPDKVIRCKSYWLLEKKYEPFAPSTPGMHGAKLTAFFRTVTQETGEPSEEDYLDLPVFVSMKGDGEYTYMGHYTQFRYSDTVGFDTLEHVPRTVLEYWSGVLADPARPEWVTQELIKHFWPKPCYEGPIPTDSAVTTPATAATGGPSSNHGTLERRVREALAEYAHELKEWDRDARMRVAKLTAANLMDAFMKADTEMPPGLRLQWEYLRCLRWDVDFYKRLVQYKHGINIHREPSKKKKAKPTLAEEIDAHCASVTALTIRHGTSTPLSQDKQQTTTSRGSQSDSKPAKQEPEKRYVAPHMRDIAR